MVREVIMLMTTGEKILIGVLVTIGVLVVVGVVVFAVMSGSPKKSNYTGNGGGGGGGDQPTRLRVTNNCSEDLWVQQLNLPGDANVFVAAGKSYDYSVPDGGTPSVRVWPKTKCDSNGENCQTGQSQAPCPSSGCQPPFESKAEFTFGDITDASATTTYDISFADGYTLPVSILAKGVNVGEDACQILDCSGLTLDQCPSSDDLAGTTGADLRVKDSLGKTIACIGPCQYTTQPAPWGLGDNISVDPALHMCCPTPCQYLSCQVGDPCNCAATNCSGCTPTSGCTWANGCATSDMCSNSSDPNSVKNTDYYSTIKKLCPRAYGYAYDDNPSNTNVTMTCPASNQYEVVFCPSS